MTGGLTTTDGETMELLHSPSSFKELFCFSIDSIFSGYREYTIYGFSIDSISMVLDTEDGLSNEFKQHAL